MRILKLRNLLILAALGSLVTFSSCDGDDDGTPPQPNLTLTANGDSVQAVAGDTISFEVNVNHEKDLESFTVAGNPPTRVDTAISGIGSQGFNYQFSYVVPSSLGAGTEVDFTFTVTDEDQESATQQYKVIVTQSGSALERGTAVLLGSQNSANEPSLYATGSLQTFALSGFDNAANDDKIDFVYYFGNTNEATIAAPSDETVAGSSNAVYDQVGNWENRNATAFTSIDANFSNIQRTTYFTEGAGSGLRSTLSNSDQTKANMLAEGDVIAFLTEDGRIGAFEVASISGENTITINVAVDNS